MPGRLFPVGGPVSEKDIVDREDFIASLEARLADGQSIMLAGPRRIGKTSIAYEVLRRLKERGFYTSSVDFFRLSDKREFAFSLINACLENRTGVRRTLEALKDRAKSVAGLAKLTVKFSDLEFSVDFLRDDLDENALLEYALDLAEILANRDSKNMVVLFDEFQDASRVAGHSDIYKRMRSHFQNHKSVSYLFLGSKEGMMNSLFGNRREAFYRFAVVLPIPPIPEDSWRMYISQKFKEQHIKADEKVIREILQKTGGHPQDTMLVCSEIYYALLETGEKTVTLEYVRLGYDRALLTLAQVYDEILDEIGQRACAREVLKRIAAGDRIYSKKDNPNEVKRALDFLITKAIIEKNGRGSYKFVEPMFREYILREL
ncbi:ATPase [Thermacetogenium phaeum DSM 12270]|uniref:ATPase n=1 Tax=Thermacetogenium phaeum (strain ATCC BAA-254 / DSM 26808 / PB) TaxID=1089553 RepID=K4LFN4_THEPS|nr:ATP-binding protein [Thermacetogenium phaeum]AFV11683.1 ATPase [Thermacetogenium phaeum DSM 12270]